MSAMLDFRAFLSFSPTPISSSFFRRSPLRSLLGSSADGETGCISYLCELSPLALTFISEHYSGVRKHGVVALLERFILGEVCRSPLVQPRQSILINHDFQLRIRVFPFARLKRLR